MEVWLVPSLQLGDRIVGLTSDPAANQALMLRYAKRLQARLGIGFQVYVDDSRGYDLLNAPEYDTNTCWVLASEVYAALTTSLFAHHHIIQITDQAVILKATTVIEQQLKAPTAPN